MIGTATVKVRNIDVYSRLSKKQGRALYMGVATNVSVNIQEGEKE